MTTTEAGGLTSLFLLAYAVAQLPSAWLLSRYGVRKVFTASMIGMSIATALTGIAGSLWALKLSRIGLGFAEGPLPIGVATTINNWFPSNEKGTASGNFLSSVKFGPVITTILGAAIIAAWGWRERYFFSSPFPAWCFRYFGICWSQTRRRTRGSSMKTKQTLIPRTRAMKTMRVMS
jgi:MFS family permease